MDLLFRRVTTQAVERKTPPMADLKDREFLLNSSKFSVELNPFTIRFTPDPKQKDAVTKAVNDYCAKFNIEEDHVDDPSQFCTVLQDSGEWRRAEVHACYLDQFGFVSEAEVEYIDEGSREFVQIQRIFMLDASLLQYPPQSVRLMPDGMVIEDSAKLSQLFNEYPEMKIRVRIKGTKVDTRRPHAVALKASIEIGYEEFIDFGELCNRLNIGRCIVQEDSSSDSSRSDDGNPFDRVEEPQRENGHLSDTGKRVEGAPVQPSAGSSRSASSESAGKSGSRIKRSLRETSRRFPESEDSAVTSADEYGTPEQILDRAPRSGGPAFDDSDLQTLNGAATADSTDTMEDEMQLFQRRHDQEIKKKLEQASQTKQRTERRVRPCQKLIRFDNCDDGDNCPYSHNTQPPAVVIGQQSHVLRECPSIRLMMRDTIFVMISYVDTVFNMYAIPIYGISSIWDTMESYTGTTMNVAQIQAKLHDFYEPQRIRNKPRVGLQPGEMASVWLDDETHLRGWHRAKFMEKDSSNLMRLFLIDHGSEVRALPSDVFSLDEQFFEWPAQAIRCTLADTKAKSDVTNERLTSRLVGKVYIMQVDDRATEADLQVHLFSATAADSIAEVLAEEGLVEHEKEEAWWMHA